MMLFLESTSHILFLALKENVIGYSGKEDDSFVQLLVSVSDSGTLTGLDPENYPNDGSSPHFTLNMDAVVSINVTDSHVIELKTKNDLHRLKFQDSEETKDWENLLNSLAPW